ncbi:MAG: SDR family NAD(P)-dependent oxidoreductase [Acidobacteria bacterium]|nr:SDR family NAD(P)-dependent oxidoreductase [Acidobacteriota bacterium]
MSALATSIDHTLEWPVVTSFTRIGCAVRRRVARWQPLEAYDLSGRVALVTGATSGIGFAAAAALLQMGAHVIVLGRDATRTESAQRQLAGRTGSERISTVLASMDDANEVRRAADEVMTQHARLDILVHNAGALAAGYRRSPIGVEVTSAAQLAGPFLLTGLLLERLAAAAPGRVISVSSGGAYLVPLTVSGLEPAPAEFDGSRQYAHAKRAQIALTELWAEHTRGRALVFQSMHPGWVDTPGLAASLPRFRGMLRPLLRSPEEGADTIAWLAADAEAARMNGAFWCDRVPRPTHRLARTRAADTSERRARLWAWCETTSGWRLPPARVAGG